MKLASSVRSLAMIPAMALAVAAAWVGGVAVRYRWIAPRQPAVDRYVPGARVRSGPEDVFVFVGASFCAACRDPGLPPLVERAKLASARRAADEHHRFRAIGVSIDWNQPRGLKLLRDFGEFDEVAAGGNWLNDEAVKYVWRDVPGRAVVPQIILLERTISAQPNGITVGREVLRERLIGEGEIRTWVRMHAQKPPQTAATVPGGRS